MNTSITGALFTLLLIGNLHMRTDIKKGKIPLKRNTLIAPTLEYTIPLKREPISVPKALAVQHAV